MDRPPRPRTPTLFTCNCGHGRRERRGDRQLLVCGSRKREGLVVTTRSHFLGRRLRRLVGIASREEADALLLLLERCDALLPSRQLHCQLRRSLPVIPREDGNEELTPCGRVHGTRCEEEQDGAEVDHGSVGDALAGRRVERAPPQAAHHVPHHGQVRQHEEHLRFQSAVEGECCQVHHVDNRQRRLVVSEDTGANRHVERRIVADGQRAKRSVALTERARRVFGAQGLQASRRVPLPGDVQPVGHRPSVSATLGHDDRERAQDSDRELNLHDSLLAKGLIFNLLIRAKLWEEPHPHGTEPMRASALPGVCVLQDLHCLRKGLRGAERVAGFAPTPAVPRRHNYFWMVLAEPRFAAIRCFHLANLQRL
eukprot:5524591-Prymnesium_polylepis.1